MRKKRLQVVRTRRLATLFIALLLLAWVYRSRFVSEPEQRFMAIVLCTKSVEGWQHIRDTALQRLLVPSLHATITSSERKKYRIQVFIAYDSDDTFWAHRQHQEEIKQSLWPFEGELFPMPKSKQSRIPFNEILQVAYEHGADYLVRVNDDSEFITNGWITRGVDMLVSFLPTNLGVVGPVCEQGNRDILTHDMVHRTHLQIFPTYYPAELDNWWVDDWISKVYGAKNTRKLVGWRMYHHTDVHGRRYEVDQRQKETLNHLIQVGKQRIDAHLIRSVH
jgi:hypothetical protein